MKQCPRCFNPASDDETVCRSCGYQFIPSYNQGPQINPAPPSAQAQNNPYGTGYPQDSYVQPYGIPVYPTYQMVVPPKYNGMSVAALVLGIVGIVLDCGAFFIPSLLAIIFGAVSKKQIEQSIGRQRGKEFANAGLIMGIIGVAICVLFWLFILVFMTSVFSTVNYSSNFDGGTNAVIGSFLFNRF